MSFGAKAKTFEMKEVGWDVNVEQEREKPCSLPETQYIEA